MNKYCTNCGAKLEEQADICIKCGKFISKVPNNNAKINKEEIFSIIGMVLGIIGFLIILIMSLGLSVGRRELISEELIIKIYCAIIFCMIPLAPSIPALVLSVLGSRNKKSVYGIIGLIASLLSTLFIIASFIYLIW